MAGSAIGGHGKEPDWTVEERLAKIAAIITGEKRGVKGLILNTWPARALFALS